MEKTFSFDSSKEHYHDAVCVVWCFDDRFSDLLAAYIKERGFAHVDVVEIAGGAKALVGDSSDRDFVLGQIRLSIALHATKRAVLMVHADCGGYGGSKAFTDHDAEITHHAEELQKAVNVLQKEFPALAIEAAIADFDGIYKAF